VGKQFIASLTLQKMTESPLKENFLPVYEWQRFTEGRGTTAPDLRLSAELCSL